MRVTRDKNPVRSGIAYRIAQLGKRKILESLY